MKVSFLGSATYSGPAPGFEMWPVPPSYCDREIASQSLRRSIENCRRAEELGFDWVSVSEHHYAPLMLTPNAVVIAGALTQAVKHAKIALLGPLLPLANPVRVAEEVAMLDAMSNGRIIVLFLRGTPNEHLAYADVSKKARAMTQEGILLILKAWTAPEPFSWHGEHFHFDRVSVWPRTRQEPHPPVFGSGNSEESVVFAARRRLGLALSFMSAGTAKRMIEIYKSEAERAGWAPTREHILYRGFGHVAEGNDSAPSAFEEADRAGSSAKVDTPARAPGGTLASPTFIFAPYFTGGARAVLRQIAALRDAGVGIVDVSLSPSMTRVDYDAQAAALERFAKTILPEIRSW
jgi:alkanesulfonate monooxygenase SsuD/methylene tetrahydromethanopterin reductase-like flavin-dependent oxidoreductase (luciferase family)